MIFSLLEKSEHEQVVFCHNADVGLRAIIAIHNTALGPAMGGTRMYPYKNEQDALADVLRLSKGMTYKSSASGLNFGGGKAVIIGDPKKDKSESLFRAFGAYVNRLKGQFITGEDVGIDVNDAEFMFMETDFVVGLSKVHGGSGDPSHMTAHGVVQGMFACVERRMNRADLKGLRVSLQGLGNVGLKLIELLKREGASVVACDVDKDKAKMAKSKFDIEIVDPDKIYHVPSDIFSPCAMGGILSKEIIPNLQCKIIAGSANNQFDDGLDGSIFHERGILYAPDYVINAGGLINVTLELDGYSERRALLLTRNIYYNLRRIFEISSDKKVCPKIAADRLAEERIRKVCQIKRSHFLDKSRIRRRHVDDI